jgi:hypothetical protein
MSSVPSETARKSPSDVEMNLLPMFFFSSNP